MFYAGYASYRRLPAARWNIRSMMVSGDVTNGLSVTMNAQNCESDLPLLTLEHSSVSSAFLFSYWVPFDDMLMVQ